MMKFFTMLLVVAYFSSGQARANSDCGSLEALTKKTESELARAVDTLDEAQKEQNRIQKNSIVFALDFDADILRDKTDRLVMAAQCILEEAHMAFDDVAADANELIEEEYQMRRSLVLGDQKNTASDKAAMLNGLKAIKFAKQALAVAKEAAKYQ